MREGGRSWEWRVLRGCLGSIWRALCGDFEVPSRRGESAVVVLLLRWARGGVQEVGWREAEGEDVCRLHCSDIVFLS